MTVRVTATSSDRCQAWKQQRSIWEDGAFDDPSSGEGCVAIERKGGTAVSSHPVKVVNKERGDKDWPSSPTAARIKGIAGLSPRERLQSLQRSDEPTWHDRSSTVGKMENKSKPSRRRIAAAAPAKENDVLDGEEPVVATSGEMPGEAEKRTKVADLIIDLWSKLPLSKLKIVVGEFLLRELSAVIAISFSVAISLVD